VRLLLLYVWRRLKATGSRSTWGYCLRCGREWRDVKPHETWFGKKLPGTRGTYGVFPLCESCWAALTPRRRLFHYWRLFRKWDKGNPDVQWDVIRQAVMEGK
jgi:hypothetical protein